MTLTLMIISYPDLTLGRGRSGYKITITTKNIHSKKFSRQHTFIQANFFLTAWVGSLATGMMFFFGPLTTSLCERFGCRIVTVIGALFCITGMLLSSFATSLPVLYITYGLTWGTGTSLCYFPTLISLSKYFKRRLALVNGIVTSGSGMGTLTLGPLVQSTLRYLGVANGLRLFAGVIALVVLLGCTFRPVPLKYTQYRQVFSPIVAKGRKVGTEQLRVKKEKQQVQLTLPVKFTFTY